MIKNIIDTFKDPDAIKAEHDEESNSFLVLLKIDGEYILESAYTKDYGELRIHREPFPEVDLNRGLFAQIYGD